MRTTGYLLPALLLLGACGTMQETTLVRDDAYDIPDRTVMASVDPVVQPAPSASDDYYDAKEASAYQQGSYYDRTYNDPTWYNRDRFGFGYNSSPWGSSWNVSYGSGWYNSPTGWYNPYWGNSWQSGYGYSGYGNGWYDPWGWNNGWGNGYGCGHSWGWGSPYGWGNNWGWNGGMYYGSGYYNGGYGGYGGYGGWGGSNDFYQSVIVQPRPSMSGGGSAGGANVSVVPRSPRSEQGIRLLRPPAARQRVITPVVEDTRPAQRDRGGYVQPERSEPQKVTPERKERKERKERPARTRERERPRDTAPTIERGGGGNSGGGNRGGGGGGGSTPTPRPRR